MNNGRVLSQPESFSIMLRGSMNPTVHHPSWYYTIGQLSKEDAAYIIENQHLYVTPALSRFRAPLFSIACDKKRWEVETRNKDARLRIAHITVKTFDELLPDTRLRRFGFKFTFSIEASHQRTVDFLSKLMADFVKVKGQGEIATTILSTTTTDPVRRGKIRLQSSPGVDRALLTFSFVYPVPDERVFTLKRISLLEDYELDYEEAATQAEQIAYTLAGGGQPAKADHTIKGN